MDETFKDIRGYEGLYQVSNKGRVKSLVSSGKILQPIKGNHGYLFVNLFFDGKRQTHLIHRLVANEFLEQKELRNNVNHKDGNQLNNNSANLEWVTHAENIQHAYLTGLMYHVPLSNHSPLCEEDIISIRRSDRTARELAEHYDVTISCIYGILKRKTWKHVK